MKNTVFTFVVIAVSTTVSHAEDRWTPSPLCPYPSENLTRFPYEGDCTKYWECFEGARYPMDCPAGLEYNERDHVCDTPSIAQCDKFETITYPTFPHSEITDVTKSSDWTPDPLCPYPSNALIYYPCAENCTQYWECYSGDRYLMDCPEGLYWNVKHNYCDYLENVDCTQNNVTLTPQPITPAGTTGSTGAWTPDPLCPYPSDKITYFVYPYNCSQYWECYEGNKYLMSCPDGLDWNELASVCDYPTNVNCDRSSTTKSPTTGTTSKGTTPGTSGTTITPAPTTGTPVPTTGNPAPTTGTPAPTTATPAPITATTPSTVTCANQPDGTFIPDADDCSKFYECDAGEPLEQHCPGNLFFDKIKHVCDFAENVTC